jgi:hypothetical protein
MSDSEGSSAGSPRYVRYRYSIILHCANLGIILLFLKLSLKL